ncbi:recombination protein RecR [Candidatus Beckwithbacteria bacterium]|nr:recombination protein RecR [Candidatus Beckwithbacteria bacterium]
MKAPKSIQKLVDNFQKLPGIGPKSAQRLTYYLLHVPQEILDDFGQSIENLKKNTKICSTCFNIGESDPCPICTDEKRDQSKICVVEQALDILAIEKSGAYKGLYHVLHGCLNPLENIGPEELHLHDLLPRIKNTGIMNITEIIIATNPTMEGEATALYIQRLIGKNNPEIVISRIGRGLPTGADIEYADEITLSRAFEGRREY